METLLVEIQNPKALNLLHELEELHLIKVLKNNEQKKQKLSKLLRASISAEAAVELNEIVQQSRNEWE